MANTLLNASPASAEGLMPTGTSYSAESVYPVPHRERYESLKPEKSSEKDPAVGYEVVEQKSFRQPEKPSAAVVEEEPSGVYKSVDQMAVPTEGSKLEQPANATSPTAGVGSPLKARAVVVDIDSETLEYDKDKDVYVATGLVHVVISEQNSELKADKIIYDQDKQILIAEGHVVIIKDGQPTEGSYARIDLTRQSALISDSVTTVQSVRVKAKKAFVDQDFVEFQNGKLILDNALLPRKSDGSLMASLAFTDVPQSAESMDRGFKRELLSSEILDLSDGKGASGRPVKTSLLEKGLTSENSPFNIRVKDITVQRDENGYDDILMKWPSLYWKNLKLATIPSVELGHDKSSGQAYYLGPDLGFNKNLGGFYAGPGWDFRLGKGMVRFSPIMTYGGGVRRSDGGRNFERLDSGVGGGALLHYRSDKTMLDVGYSTRNLLPVAYGERKLFGEHTKLQVAANENYINGFMGQERPAYIAQVVDDRELATVKGFTLSSHAALGWARDDFYPTNDAQFFVTAPSNDPQWAGRAQMQLQLYRPDLVSLWGETLQFGLLGQTSLSGYTTGDFYGVFRGGPTVNVNLGNRFKSSIAYLIGETAGSTPFVFDSYYFGRQNLTLNNALRVHKYLTVGTLNSFSLEQDNARSDRVVGNMFYAMVGPRDVKFNIAYDFIRKRSYFGINFFPGSGETPVAYDRMRIYQPQSYGTPGLKSNP
ncbi:MAG: LptA/OstA family protein [Candidatus Melainabacteria bacterium]|nr:LptA/OstA family protein [Candidatus Melainabacteria bacterium]